MKKSFKKYIPFYGLWYMWTNLKSDPAITYIHFVVIIVVVMLMLGWL